MKNIKKYFKTIFNSKSEKEELDEYHYHEFIDRSFITLEIIDAHLMNHPVCLQNPELKSLVDQSLDALSDAYQHAGRIAFEKYEQESLNE